MLKKKKKAEGGLRKINVNDLQKYFFLLSEAKKIKEKKEKEKNRKNGNIFPLKSCSDYVTICVAFPKL